MALPAFTRNGDLPVGVHPATLHETVARFGTATGQRQMIALRLLRIHSIARATGCLARFLVFGSFVTDKPVPNDVDVFMLMEDNFDAGALSRGQSLLFDHTMGQTTYGASVFWLRRAAAFGGEDAAVSHWQIKRDGTERGIVEIIEESQ